MPCGRPRTGRRTRAVRSFLVRLVSVGVVAERRYQTPSILHGDNLSPGVVRHRRPPTERVDRRKRVMICVENARPDVPERVGNCRQKRCSCRLYRIGC